MQIDRYQQSASFSIGNLNRNSNAFRGQYTNSNSETIATSGIFAADIVSRIGKGGQETQASGAEATYKELGKNSSRNLDGLQASLKNTINSIAQRHGTSAATAVMGIVYKNLGTDVTEESIGQGFIQAISFIDRNYGISEGNQLMNELNESVNKEMNEYFDNGASEVFFDPSEHTNALRIAKGFRQSTDGMFDSVVPEGSSSFKLDGPLNTNDMQKMALEAQAKRILASGEFPPAYLQEYLPSSVMPGVAPGGLLDSTV